MKPWKLEVRPIHQANDEFQAAKHIRQEQEKIKQQMVVIHHDLKKIDTQTSILKEEQSALSDELKDIQELFDEIHSDLNFAFQKLSKIKLNQEEIDFKFDQLNKQV